MYDDELGDDPSHLRESLADAETKIKQLSEGLENRNVIGIAQGIVMERLELDADHAFEYLKRVSSYSNRKVALVAADIARTRRLPDLDDG